MSSYAHLEEQAHVLDLRMGNDYSAQVPLVNIHESVKNQILQSLRVLREIARELHEFNLELETIDRWRAEIERVSASLVPTAPNNALLVLAPFEQLNHILTQCLTASGPMRRVILQNQALELLKYIQIHAEEYKLIQNGWVYFDIGRWMERLS